MYKVEPLGVMRHRESDSDRSYVPCLLGTFRLLCIHRRPLHESFDDVKEVIVTLQEDLANVVVLNHKFDLCLTTVLGIRSRT